MAAIDSTALNELYSVDVRTLFATIDKLSALGVGGIAPFPQIIVVGDQSCGKSSVLEAISHIHFPAKGDGCTQFTIEVVLHPSNHCSVAATVHFADGTSPAHSLHITDFKQDDIRGIIEEAKEKMGISENATGFSKDVLRLEIEGPDLPPLTLIDLPGMIPTATAKQSEEDKETVMELARSYMKMPNSIILAIIPADTQFASQAIMQEATKHDPMKTRTLGVITKPDMLQLASSSGRDFVRRIKSRDAVYDLPLGWQVLRNRADNEVDFSSRETMEEEFFKSGHWALIPPRSRGITSLRAKLSRILLDHIKKGVPALLENLQDKLSKRKVELEQLGPPRNSPEDMRSYLIDIASSFDHLVRDGVQGRYIHPFYHGWKGRDWRLRAQLRNLSKSLRHVLLTFGCNQAVTERPGWTSPRSSVPNGFLKKFMKVHQYTDNLPRPTPITWAQLNYGLERQAATHQGMEFPGYVNTDIAMRFFHSQSMPWRCIAERHIKVVLDVTKAYVEAIFEHLIGPFSSNSTTRAILSTVVDDYFDAKEKVLTAKLEELLRPYQDGYALPLDADFNEMMDRSAAQRTAFAADVGGDIEPRRDTRTTSGRLATELIIDTVQTFYDMALQTFTDNVNILAVESCLVQDISNIFTPRQVSNMDNSKLKKLAAESQEVRASRSRLKEEIRLLEEGLERCRPYRPRAVLNVPSHTCATSFGPQADASQGIPTCPVKVKLPPSKPPADQETHPVPPAASSTQRGPPTPPPTTVPDPTTTKAPIFSFDCPPGTGLFGSKPVRPNGSDPKTTQATVGTTGHSQGVPHSSTSDMSRGERPVSVLADAAKQQGQAFQNKQSGSIFSSPSRAIPATTTNKTTAMTGNIFGSFSASSPGSASSASEPSGLGGSLSASSSASPNRTSQSRSTSLLDGASSTTTPSPQPRSGGLFGNSSATKATVSAPQSGGLFGGGVYTPFPTSQPQSTSIFGVLPDSKTPSSKAATAVTGGLSPKNS